MKRRNLIAILLCLACAPRMAQAQLVITEIMYDPLGADSGHEWIEVYNASEAPTAFAKYKLRVSDANHNIIATGTSTLAAGSYAVIAANVAKFEADHPDYAGALFHSSFSLNNAGATIAVVLTAHASSTVLTQASYDSAEGALADGNSLQRPPESAASFVPRTPTPGGAIAGTAIAPHSASVRTSSPAKKTPKHVAFSTSDSDGSDAPSTAHRAARVSPQSAAAAAPASQHPWWLGVLALAVAACAVVYSFARAKRSEWDIVDESGKDV